MDKTLVEEICFFVSLFLFVEFHELRFFSREKKQLDSYFRRKTEEASPAEERVRNCARKMAEDDDMDEKVFGGCEGPEAMYVKLISSDGHEFIVKRDHALTSGTIKAMLSGPGEWLSASCHLVS